MTVKTRPVEYSHDGKIFEGLLALDDATTGKRPAVMISHAWADRSPVKKVTRRKLRASAMRDLQSIFTARAFLGKRRRNARR